MHRAISRKSAIRLGSLTIAALIFTSSAPVRATVVYDDGFSRVSAFDGSQPDVDTNANTWTATNYNSIGADSTPITPNGTMLPSATYNIDGGVLPVNGTSGIVLNGSQNFTLSADIVNNAAGGNSVGIFLSSSVSTNNALADIEVGPGATAAVEDNSFNSTVAGGNGVYNSGQGVSVELVYSASAGTITFDVNGAPNNVYFGSDTLAVTPAQIQALDEVGFNFWYDGPNLSSIDNFKLDVAQVPEPASLSLLALGLPLLMRRARRNEA